MEKFPGEFIARIKTQQYIDDKLLLRSLDEPSPPSIRINRLKWNRIPSGADGVPWCSDGWYLEKRPSYTLDPLFHAGCYYPQEASGMFTGEFFRRLTEGMGSIRILDLCAAPGGKSTHISSLAGPGSLLVANEVIRMRASILADNITRWGTGNVIVTSSDPSRFARLKGWFDVILVDAPCSGEGMFRDPVAVREWSVGNTVLCSERQKRILSDAWPSLKENGILIYSTCTFNPAENESQIRWLTVSGRAESVFTDTGLFPGVKEIDFEGIRGYGFHPGSIRGEGFFIAAVRKIEEEKGEAFRAGKNTRGGSAETRKRIGPFVSGEPGSVMNDSGRIIAVPVAENDLYILQSHLNIVQHGTQIGTLMNNELIPSHELILSRLFSAGSLPSAELTLDQAVAFLRKETLRLTGLPAGWITVKYRGVNLGLVKNIGSRLNNYLPASWRIRMSPDREKIDNLIAWD